ncbi:secreted RxLR effector protein 161-like [Impatiens glandulifera]|uniref:secreted RxLR effector protein 161-like n=1 Tax=Impatiens glandulifera TaxID=253017 RepID=UPI001FB0D335|nr:secreted RxLR effector protein 161-like [Impatiens glandulifera]
MLSVGIASRFMENPSYKALKCILRYVQGTLLLGLFNSKSNDYQLVGYSDSDLCGDAGDKKSTSAYVFLLGNTTFTWLLKKQPIVTLSTCEAKYMATSWSMCHVVWLSNLPRHLGVIRDDGTIIRVDNKSAIELAKNPVKNGRSKCIDV